MIMFKDNILFRRGNNDSEGSGDRNEARGILKLEEKVEISLIVLLSRA